MITLIFAVVAFVCLFAVTITGSADAPDATARCTYIDADGYYQPCEGYY